MRAREQAILRRGRRAAERLMVDTCTVSYLAGRGPVDRTTGVQPDLYDIAFTSPCEVKAGGGIAPTVRVGDEERAIERPTIKLPVSAPQVREGAVVEITAVDPHSDPRLLGRRFSVEAPMNGTAQTATRLIVKGEL